MSNQPDNNLPTPEDPPKFPWTCVQGTDFGRAIANQRSQESVSIVWTVFEKILIVCHNRNQMNVFMQNWHLPQNRTMRVFTMDSLRGIDPTRPDNIMFALPDYDASPEAAAAAKYWQGLHGKLVYVSEHQLLRRDNDEPVK